MNSNYLSHENLLLMKLEKLIVRNLNIFKYIIFNIFKNYI